MSTIGMILAWTVCGIIALVGGAVVGMALANLLNPKRRSHNYVAWRVFTRQHTHGDVFIIKDKGMAAKFRDVLDGKMYTSHYPKKCPDYPDACYAMCGRAPRKPCLNSKAIKLCEGDKEEVQP